MRSESKAIIFLIVFSPITAEFLSSSMTIPEIINPISFMFLVTLYGFGALIIREASLHTENRWGFIVFAGMAYGVIEEGLACKSFYNPEWPDLDVLAYYGRYAGINTVWTLHLIIFHSIVSIAIPIAVTEMCFSECRGRRLTSNRRLGFFGATFTLTVIIFNVVFPYEPSLTQYMFSFILIALFISIGLIMPHRMTLKIGSPNKKILMLLGALWMLLFFFTFFGLPNLGASPIHTFIIALTLNVVYLLLFSTIDWNYYTDLDKLDIAFSPLWFLILLWLISLNPERTIVALLFASIHIKLRSIIKRT